MMILYQAVRLPIHATATFATLAVTILLVLQPVSHTQEEHPGSRECSPEEGEPELSEEQAEVVRLIVEEERNVFYTGSAGCGKSTVLKAFVRCLRSKNKRIWITAPTGIAALTIGGTTIHTFAGWGLKHEQQPLEDVVKASSGVMVWKRLNDLDVLIIDEISMVGSHLFERLNALLQYARRDSRAFGGVQLVVTGDFCQLPPVCPFEYCLRHGNGLEKDRLTGVYFAKPRQESPCDCVYKDSDKWAFRSDVWEECGFQHVHLTEIHRQSDKTFIDILQKFRLGTMITDEDRRILLHHPADTTGAIQLFRRREDARRLNDQEFAKLKTRNLTFRCADGFRSYVSNTNLSAEQAERAERARLELEKEYGKRSDEDGTLTAYTQHRFERVLELKYGMLVLLLSNLDIAKGLVNGSQGTIVGFRRVDAHGMPRRKDSNKERKDTRNRFLDSGASYLLGDHAERREAQVREFFYKTEDREWPVVRFTNGVTKTIFPDCSITSIGSKGAYCLVSRTQIPLVAAWAITVHKSQGMTLDRVIVDLSRSFEEGREYVALSRARGLAGLKVTGLGKCTVGGNAQVKEFMWKKFGLA